jgi:hypothetical protein
VEITLTVQSCGDGKFRFGLNTKDSAQYFIFKHLPVVIIIDETLYITKTTCGQHKFNEKDNSIIFTKGFDLYSEELSKFIIEKKWHNYKRGKPTKIQFDIEKQSNGIVLKFKNKII